MKRMLIALLLLCPTVLFAQLEPFGEVYLPVVGDVVGQDGTHFRTDVTLSNLDQLDQRVRIEWIPADRFSAPLPPRTMTIPGWTVMPLHDFVPEVFETTGMGALRIVAIDAEGNRDPDAAIDAFARIWSDLLGGEGTVSQSLYGVHSDRMVVSSGGVPNMMLVGLKHDANFRTNVGIVNPSDELRSFDIRILGTEGTEMFRVHVFPNTMVQVPLPAGVYGDVALNVTPTENLPDPWTAYASTVDNRSADAWIAQDAHRRFHETP